MKHTQLTPSAEDMRVLLENIIDLYTLHSSVPQGFPKPSNGRFQLVISISFTVRVNRFSSKYISQVYLHCFRLEMQLSLSLFLSLSLSRYMFRQ
jgi:hypothetical protein